MGRTQRLGLAIAATALTAMLAPHAASAASPSVEQALRLKPIQPDVDYSRPTAEEAARCRIEARKVDGRVGWIVEDSQGLLLRRFIDTDGDNVVDQWSYYRDGLEVYRDIDANQNGRADQYRWFHTGGSRWGLDENEDGEIDRWKNISAEEVTAEVVAALADHDAARFVRVLVAPGEIGSLGLGEARAEQLAKKVAAAAAGFAALAGRQTAVGEQSEWVQFSGGQPGVVPAGTDGLTRDLLVYENVVAIAASDGTHAELTIGTLVLTAGGWRVIDLPQVESGTEAVVAGSGFFFQTPVGDRAGLATGGAGGDGQELISQLEQLDRSSEAATTPEQKAAYNARRADLLEKIAAAAASGSDRAMWLRQLADMVSAAVQAGEYPAGAQRLKGLVEKLEADPNDRELAAYVAFRQLAAEYGLKMQAAGSDTEKLGQVQTEWLGAIEQYVKDYSGTPDTAEAMLQLGISEEFAGKEDAAEQWYARVVSELPDSAAARKAAGARARLESVGRQIAFSGRNLTGGTVDLAEYRGRVVLIQFWATWCDPCKRDLPVLKDLAGKRGRDFAVIGVSLDNSRETLVEYLGQNRLPWPQIFEEGGLDSRPANQLGILTLPTMILVDQQGRVVNRNVQATELEDEVEKLLR